MRIMTATDIKTPVTFYAEATPNPETMKFVANRLLVKQGATAEFLSAQEASASPLAVELFKFPFVKSIFVCNNFVAITKHESVSWDFTVLELRTFLKRYVETGKDIVSDLPTIEVKTDSTENAPTEEVHSEHVAPANELEHRIARHRYPRRPAPIDHDEVSLLADFDRADLFPHTDCLCTSTGQ